MKVVSYIFFVVGSAFLACSASPVVDKPTQARVSYEGQLANCVAQAKAKHPEDTASAQLAGRIESDDCADKVKAQWAAKDGGL